MNEVKSLSKYIELDLSPLDNLDELNYRERIQPTEEKYRDPERWMKLILSDRRLELALKIRKFLGNGCSVLEIDAGSCWLSSILSKFPEVKEFTS